MKGIEEKMTGKRREDKRDIGEDEINKWEDERNIVE